MTFNKNKNGADQIVQEAHPKSKAGATAAEPFGAGAHLDLQHEYRKFFQAVEASPSCVVITDRSGVIEYVNDRFVKSTGYSQEHVIGRKPNLLKSGQTPTHVYDTLWSTILKGEIWRGEMCNRKRTGERYWESTAIAPILGPQGDITHFVAVKEDITVRRDAEAALRLRQAHDTVLADITRGLLADASGAAIEEALRILSVSLDAQRGALFRLSADNLYATNTHASTALEWVEGEKGAGLRKTVGIPRDRFQWCLDQYRDGKTVMVDNALDLPADAEAFRTSLLRANIHAHLSAPIQLGERFIGFVSVDVQTSPRKWTTDDAHLLERVAEIIGLALMRLDAEQELRTTRDRASRAEQNLTDAINSMPEGFVLYDQDGKLVICNSRFRNDYGYTQAQARPGVHFMDLGLIDVMQGNVVVPEGYKNADEYLQIRLKYRIKLEGTFQVILKDGRQLMTQDRRTSSGGLVSVQTDITKIKQTEDALRSSERKFWSIFHASPSLMTISVLKDGQFLDVNAKWVEVMGFDYTEAIGKTSTQLEVWHSSLAREQMLRAFTKDGVLVNYEARMQTRAKEMRDFLMSGVRMHIDGEDALLLVYHDITERKRMEAALQQSERDVRAILDNIVEAFYRTDKKGRFTMCSAGVIKLLGYEPDELVGTPVSAIYVDASGRDEFLKQLAVRGGRIENYEIQLRRKDGTTVWAATNSYYYYDDDGEILGVEGTSRDVTWQRQAEQDLLIAKELAENANAAKSDFLSGMSHELRTPLNAIIGFSQMMAYQDSDSLTPKQREYIDIISRSGEHLLTVINEVLDLASIEAGRTSAHLEAISATAVIDDCIELVRTLSAEKGVLLVRDYGDTPVPLVWVDRTKFKQVLINLLSNAVKYNVDGGRVDVMVSVAPGNCLKIDVTDTGHGLTEAECQDLFQPFQRLHAQDGDVEGTGLGLVLAKRMIEAMHGDIQVSSTPGVGSTFTVKVPLSY
ncbi:PAS domain S-box protein [Magnetovibrio blakemorei]|uniref:histidine kinase n=1 Tax=Magnetovibrio blakemorei TaxID=28181 RepID=A0A1E5QC29_9PROT|nr:PAS domain S-box protein [Magnetovibrio blakemorei]OEJ69646.1 hypothetical protein BEN30_02075 [Magnetovibrio blakemorei]